MPLLIKEVQEDSVLKSHDVKAGDYLAHINAWAVRTRGNVQTAYRSNHLDLVFRRDNESFEVQVEANDLGIMVEDEDGEVFEVKRPEAAGEEHRECKNICVNGILINSLEGHQNANIRQTYRSAA